MNRLVSNPAWTLVLLTLSFSLPGFASIPSAGKEISGTALTAPDSKETGKLASRTFSDVKATVVVFLSSKCPCSASHEPILKTLHEKFAPKGIAFIAMHANQDEPLSESKPHFEAAGLPFAVLEDQGAAFANRLGALKTPHAFVISPTGDVLYSGGVDDSNDPARARRFYLADALTAVSEGRAPSEKETRTLGCVIKREPN